MNKLLFGFAAGLVVGILFAPNKGSETREKVARRGRALKDRFDDFVDSIVDKFESVKHETDEFAEKAKQKARSYTGQGNSWAGETNPR